jgi:hypothetical protein
LGDGVVVHVPGELTALTIEIVDRQRSVADTGHLCGIGTHDASDVLVCNPLSIAR